MKYPVTKDVEYGSWVALTTAGQSGTCWLDSEDDGAEGSVQVRIVHADDGEPDLSEATNGYPVKKPSGNNDAVTILANNESDIYYATCLNEGAKAKIQVDVV